MLPILTQESLMAKQVYKPDEILEIVWDDAATTNSWHSPNHKCLRTNCGLIKVTTAGHFLRMTKKAIQVSHAISKDGDRKDTQAIPIGSIRKVKRLR